MKRQLLRYGITFAVGALLAFLGCTVRGVFAAAERGEVFRFVSDGCLIAGILLAGAGLLVLAANGGTFDIFGYGFLCFFTLFAPPAKRRMKRSFAEYRQAKREKKQSFLYLLIVGCVFLALAGLFAGLFYLG